MYNQTGNRHTQYKNYVKEFDTVTMACQYLNDAGEPIPLDGITITAQMQNTSNRLVDTLVVDVLDSQQGTFTLTPSINRLPVGQLEIDVLFTKDGSRLSSESFHLLVKRAVTEPVGDAWQL